jgi:hypothetical protein
MPTFSGYRIQAQEMVIVSTIQNAKPAGISGIKRGDD